jgi:hypothetical protein
MPRGDKAKYSGKQKRQAQHIEERFEEKGMGRREEAGRAWKIVNKITGGGKRGGSGEGKPINKEPMRKGGRRGAAVASSRPKSARSNSAKTAARTRTKKAARTRATRGTARRSSTRRTRGQS